MKQFKDIKRKLEWEQYYDPDFDWNDPTVYIDDNNSLRVSGFLDTGNKLKDPYLNRPIIIIYPE